MKEFNDLTKLISFIRLNSFGRIGIDGVNRSGKSTLAKTIAELMKYQHINLDDFLVKKQGGFLDFLKYNEICESISGSKDYIIEGVCLLDVLERVNTNIDCLIYVKKVKSGTWVDEHDCLLDGDLEKVIEDRKYLIQLTNPSGDMPETLGLAEEIMRYHKSYKPNIVADVVFLSETTNKNRHCDS